MENMFANLPMGKEDKPLLLPMGPLVYDYHDVDGLYYMLDRRLSGCMIFLWSKQMLPLEKGTVLNLFGKGIYQFRNGAVGAGKISPRYSVNLVEAIQEDDYFNCNQELIEFYRCDDDQIPPETLLNQARKKSDLAIILLSRAAGWGMEGIGEAGRVYKLENYDIPDQAADICFPTWKMESWCLRKSTVFQTA